MRGLFVVVGEEAGACPRLLRLGGAAELDYRVVVGVNGHGCQFVECFVKLVGEMCVVYVVAVVFSPVLLLHVRKPVIPSFVVTDAEVRRAYVDAVHQFLARLSSNFG